ncbi:MAG: helix-turn-helix transcriptional regulator [Deltaproteobacteria bacterium]|nr:helix-turn-helix transcriptional regulator [Deltaproteobacteria bacterium]
MQFMLTLGERIKHIRDSILKINQASFADMLGFSRIATISDYEKNKRNPDISTLCKIADLSSVSVDWLLTGRGEIFSSDAARSMPPLKETGGPLYFEEHTTVEVYSMAGSGRPAEFPKGEPVGVISIPKRDSMEGIVAVRVEGEGMSPNILDGATVGINTKDRHLISGKLYAVWLDYEGVTIKRVFVYPDRIVLKPDNPTFPETAVPTANIGAEFIIGRVKWVFQRH